MANELSIRMAQVHVPNTCAWCDDVHNVNWYCNDCQEALCNRCKETHQRARRTRIDDVVPIKEATKQGQVVLPEVCKIHPGKTCDLFCTDCEIAICSMCLTQKHKQHTFKHFEDEVESQIHYMHGQMEMLKSKLVQLSEKISNRHQANKIFKDSVEVIRKDVLAQGSKLKAEVDSIVNSILDELSSLVAQEDNLLKQDCERDEKNVNEIKLLIREVEHPSVKPSIKNLFELAGRLRTTIPLYNVTGNSVLPRPPRFITGQLNTEQLKAILGHVQAGYEKDLVVKYARNEINSQHCRTLSTFQVSQKMSISAICPANDTHAWISVNESEVLIQVDKNGNIIESVSLDFEPSSMASTSISELLIACSETSSLIYKLSEDRRVTTFADICPFAAWNISVSDNDEVFVSTDTTKILVLNMSGERVRQLSRGQVGSRIVSLTEGTVAVTTGDVMSCTKLSIINKTDKIIHIWSGKLENGQKISKMRQDSIASDIFDRVYVPDHTKNQVYVISRNDKNAKSLLDEKHQVIGPMVVCVDRCGHVWIGCSDGTVYVMQLCA